MWVVLFKVSLLGVVSEAMMVLGYMNKRLMRLYVVGIYNWKYIWKKKFDKTMKFENSGELHKFINIKNNAKSLH